MVTNCIRNCNRQSNCKCNCLTNKTANVILTVIVTAVIEVNTRNGKIDEDRGEFMSGYSKDSAFIECGVKMKTVQTEAFQVFYGIITSYKQKNKPTQKFIRR